MRCNDQIVVIVLAIDAPNSVRIDILGLRTLIRRLKSDLGLHEGEYVHINIVRGHVFSHRLELDFFELIELCLEVEGGLSNPRQGEGLVHPGDSRVTD